MPTVFKQLLYELPLRQDYAIVDFYKKWMCSVVHYSYVPDFLFYDFPDSAKINGGLQNGCFHIAT